MPIIQCQHFLYGKIVTPDRKSQSYDIIAHTPDLEQDEMNSIYRSIDLGSSAEPKETFFLSSPRRDGSKVFATIKGSTREIAIRDFKFFHFIILPKKVFMTEDVPNLVQLTEVVEKNDIFRAYYQKTTLTPFEVELFRPFSFIEFLQDCEEPDWKKLLDVLRGILNYQFVNIYDFRDDSDSKLELMQVIFELLPPQLRWYQSFATSVYSKSANSNIRVRFLETSVQSEHFTLNWATGQTNNFNLDSYYVDHLEDLPQLPERKLNKLLRIISQLDISIAGDIKYDRDVQRVSKTVSQQIEKHLLQDAIEDGTATIENVVSYLLEIKDRIDRSHEEMLFYCLQAAGDLETHHQHKLAEVVSYRISDLDNNLTFTSSLESSLQIIPPLQAPDFLTQCIQSTDISSLFNTQQIVRDWFINSYQSLLQKNDFSTAKEFIEKVAESGLVTQEEIARAELQWIKTNPDLESVPFILQALKSDRPVQKLSQMWKIENVVSNLQNENRDLFDLLSQLMGHSDLKDLSTNLVNIRHSLVDKNDIEIFVSIMEIAIEFRKYEFLEIGELWKILVNLSTDRVVQLVDSLSSHLQHLSVATCAVALVASLVHHQKDIARQFLVGIEIDTDEFLETLVSSAETFFQSTTTIKTLQSFLALFPKPDQCVSVALSLVEFSENWSVRQMLMAFVVAQCRSANVSKKTVKRSGIRLLGLAQEGRITLDADNMREVSVALTKAELELRDVAGVEAIVELLDSSQVESRVISSSLKKVFEEKGIQESDRASTLARIVRKTSNEISSATTVLMACQLMESPSILSSNDLDYLLTIAREHHTTFGASQLEQSIQIEYGRRALQPYSIDFADHIDKSRLSDTDVSVLLAHDWRPNNVEAVKELLHGLRNIGREELSREIEEKLLKGQLRCSPEIVIGYLANKLEAFYTILEVLESVEEFRHLPDAVGSYSNGQQLFDIQRKVLAKLHSSRRNKAFIIDLLELLEKNASGVDKSDSSQSGGGRFSFLPGRK